MTSLTTDNLWDKIREMKIDQIIKTISYEEHVSLLVELGLSYEEAEQTVMRVRSVPDSVDEDSGEDSGESDVSVESEEESIPQYHGRDKYFESVIGNLNVSARSDMGDCYYQEDDIYYREVNGKVVVACFDGHVGSACVNKAMDIFKRCCGEMTSITNKTEILAWFKKTFVEPLQSEDTGVCVLMGVVDSRGGWFLNLGDCRLYVDGIPKTKDSNVSSLTQKDRTELEKKCGVSKTHLIRIDGYVTHYLAVTASLGDKIWNSVLCRIPEVVFVNKFNKISLMTDGVTQYLKDDVIGRLSNANEILGEVYAACHCPTKSEWRRWHAPTDNTSAICVMKM